MEENVWTAVLFAGLTISGWPLRAILTIDSQLYNPPAGSLLEVVAEWPMRVQQRKTFNERERK
jgi:hypothetical protein